MKRFAVILTAVGALALHTSAHSQSTRHSFTLNAPSIKGFPSGEIVLTGGGSYDLATDSVKAGGHFNAIHGVNQGPLAGCLDGQGIRWDVEEIVPSTQFKCTGAASEPLKPAFTSDDTIVLKADFYREGDGNEESFRALMIVSAHDLDPDRDGIQNVWVQGVGCGTALVNFN